jgi:hypothetical protein
LWFGQANLVGYGFGVDIHDPGRIGVRQQVREDQ